MFVKVGQDVTKHDQHERTPCDVPKQLWEPVSMGDPASKRKRHGCAHDKRKAWLDKIPERAPFPGRMIEL